jgi:DNA-binding transcriptional LysR family regulator
MATSGIPDLTSRQLQTILAVAEYGSFIAAAALMNHAPCAGIARQRNQRRSPQVGQ